MKTQKMRVFVWENVLEDYTPGMMVAVAPSVEQAREELLKECSYIPKYDLEKQPKELDLSKCAAFLVWGGG